MSGELGSSFLSKEKSLEDLSQVAARSSSLREVTVTAVGEWKSGARL